MPRTCDLPNDSEQMTVHRGDETLMKLEKIVELDTGRSAAELRNFTLDEFRAKIEGARGNGLRFVSRFPFLGRGNVMRDKTVDHETVNRLLDDCLRE